MAERAAECEERGGFLYVGLGPECRDIYRYERVDVDGVSYTLEALGVLAWSCDCPAAKSDPEGFCKHQYALQRQLVATERRLRAMRAARAQKGASA